jgi:acetylcholinesterase
MKALYHPFTTSTLGISLLLPGKLRRGCLTLNIWGPVGVAGRYVEKLSVIVWIYGGGFQTGGGEIGYQIPSQWVQRSQAHIVVGIKYTANSSMH